MPTAVYVFEDSQFDRLFPLTLARPALALRCGARTLLERAVAALPLPVAGVLVRPSLAAALRKQIALPVNPPVSTRDGVLLLNGRWLALEADGRQPEWTPPQVDSVGLASGAIAWANLSAKVAAQIDFAQVAQPQTLEAILPTLQRQPARATLICRPWELIAWQNTALRADFASFGAANQATVMPGAHLLVPENIHLGRNVKVWPGAVLDAQNGPIIIEEGTEIRANAVLTGPVHVGRNCLVRTGADLRELCSLGPGTRVGGEVLHSIFLGYANKQHHGFVGQSIIGEWANLGAGTTTSNLKNTYGTIRVPINGIEEDTGTQFLGALIGDHAKLGIGTYLSTGSVIGFGSHVLAPRPPKFVPSFAWVDPERVTRLDFAKFEAIATTVMHRRGVEFSPAEHELFVQIATDYALSEKFDWAK